MGQGSINQYQGPKTSPIEGILAALQAAHSYYGINTEKQKQELQAQQIDLAKKQNDPNSTESKAAQAESKLALDYAVDHHYTTADKVSSLRNLIGGTPAVQGVPAMGPAEENGMAPRGGIAAQAAVPGLSSAALAKNSELGPFFGLIKGQQAADAMGNKFNSINDTKKEMQQNTIHQQILGRVDKDPTLSKQLVQYQNLDNSLSLITKSDHITPQQFDEFQQSVRGNLGIKGNSGVDERSHTYLNSVGLNADRWQQILTGAPANLKPDDPFLSHVKQLASIEQNNVQAQTQRRLSTLTSGNNWLYDQRPDLAAGLKSKIEAVGSQYVSNSPSTTPDTGGGGSPFPGSNAQADTMVNVISPEGKVGRIPKANLNTALQRGFKAQ